MQSFKLTLASLALLLAACAPAALAKTPAAAVAATGNETVAATVTTTLATDNAAPTPQFSFGEATSATVAQAASQTNTATHAATTTTLSASAEVAAAPAQAQQKYEVLTSPVDLLASYYNAINLKDYQRAYGYWQTPPMSYNAFANGFSDTTSVQLIVQPPTSGEGAAGSTFVQIATFLIAKHTDGSTHSYAGCIVTRKSNLQPPDIPEVDVWHLYSASLAEVPNSANIPGQLAGACQP